MDELWEKRDKYVRIAAPMVRYSKLPFRLTARKFGTDLAYTPMIIADSFHRSDAAADADFLTSNGDRPLGVQFAASDPEVLWKATERVANLTDTVDLNCGCPQKWAIQEGIGCALLKDAELISDMVKTLKRRCSIPMSVKIRIDSDLRKTVDLVQKACAARADCISIHARTPTQRSSVPANWAAAKLVIESIKLFSGYHTKTVLNGDIFSASDADAAYKETGVDGVMSARGLLENPALYSGAQKTPNECVNYFVRESVAYGVPFQTTHQHCIYMLQSRIFGAARREFNEIRCMPTMINWLDQRSYI
mmetsp:Transcript_9041/g.27181  ORF Transcript_9041/g.27181 Transcript_9041/m.27181 type:complete len:306 (+) Transcript_9041:277-1194(+)|eukprot:CAMPEP_0198728890 /NCGR_PEP_ID=MMETSP1475-20131203/11894_1 /TAXON_ID= ORGANISM="Unidentified sp., Strain CCMP1999" /NCGR_SAMPLE_ID=MMETSP1475 /ASSEMBLY_ACC=CAM_ASM_001111 /LENGTH=305 /DNA_ID=CAMNT_0044491367 /DNA_START=196 /DNA_END=1113 /DNA_ORIENTATION=+